MRSRLGRFEVFFARLPGRLCSRRKWVSVAFVSCVGGRWSASRSFSHSKRRSRSRGVGRISHDSGSEVEANPFNGWSACSG